MGAIRQFVAVVLLLAFTLDIAFAQAQPARVGRAVSGTIQTSLIQRGFAANDPRFGNTLARITPYLASSAGGAAAVTAAGVTAPAWVSVALAIGVGTVVAYGVNLALDGLVNWLFRDDGKIDQTSGGSGYTAAGFNPGDTVWRYQGPDAIYRYGGDGEALARQKYYEDAARLGNNNPAAPTCYASGTTMFACGNSFVSKVSNSPVGCPQGQMAVGAVCTAYTYPLSSSNQIGLTPQQAIDAIPASDLNRQLNPALVAGLANRAWQQAAAQPDYDGLPYPQSNPITQTEASTWLAQNPAYSPTVQDFVTPNPSTTANPQPWSMPANPAAQTTTPAVPNSSTVNPAASEPLVNLGPDPGIGAPTLEATPTAQEILNPVVNMVPSLRNFTVSAHPGVCPRPSFDLYGTHVFEAHCAIIDEVKPILQAGMMVAWAIMALLIILSA